MKIKRNIFAALVLVAALLSCSRETVVESPSSEQRKATIVNSPEGAQSGELIVKFCPELSDLLDQAAITKSGERANVLEATGIKNVDDLLSYLGGCTLERVFPVDVNNEERTRKSGFTSGMS